MHQHLSSCEEFLYLVNLINLLDIETESKIAITNSHIFKAVKENWKVLTTSDNWLTLAYLEPLLAKKNNASINHGARAMRSLNLF